MDKQTTELYKLEEEIMHDFIMSLPNEYFDVLESLFRQKGVDIPNDRESKLRLLAALCEECLSENPNYELSEDYQLGLEFLNGLDHPSVLHETE